MIDVVLYLRIIRHDGVFRKPVKLPCVPSDGMIVRVATRRSGDVSGFMVTSVVMEEDEPTVQVYLEDVDPTENFGSSRWVDGLRASGWSG
jgi:hypothetical protein